jgi:hypothetical protein
MVVRRLRVLCQQNTLFLDRGILFGVIAGLTLIFGDPAGENIILCLRHFLQLLPEYGGLALQEKVSNDFLLFMGLRALCRIVRIMLPEKFIQVES